MYYYNRALASVYIWQEENWILAINIIISANNNISQSNSVCVFICTVCHKLYKLSYGYACIAARSAPMM